MDPLQLILIPGILVPISKKTWISTYKIRLKAFKIEIKIEYSDGDENQYQHDLDNNNR